MSKNKRSRVIPPDNRPKFKDVTPKVIVFDEKITKKYPEFRPNLTPKQMFELGSFHDQGGYFRDIKSVHYKEMLEDTWKKYTKKGKCLEGVDKDLLVTPKSFKTKKSKIELNKYKKKAGLSLKQWHEYGWMDKQDPYGWVQWYCEFYDGRRSDRDDHQINRWIKFAGENSGRWNKNLMNKIINADTTYGDFKISPIIRQSLQHWAYQLTEEDLIKYEKSKSKISKKSKI